MGMIPAGRNLLLASIVTSLEVKNQVQLTALANALQAKLSTAGINLGGQPSELPTPLYLRTVEDRLSIQFQRVETTISIYLNLTAPVNSLLISNMISESWNAVSTENHARNLLSRLSDGVTAERPLGIYQCPPGSVFEVGTRDATLLYTSGNAIQGFFWRIAPVPEKFYQVQTRHSPQPVNGQVLRGTVGIIDSVTTSDVTDSNVPSMVGTSTSQYSLPTAADVGNAASRAGQAISRTAAETIGGVTGMGASDIKFVMYATLGIVGALVLVKVLKEVKAI
jgi:hypothetical protein